MISKVLVTRSSFSCKVTDMYTLEVIESLDTDRIQTILEALLSKLFFRHILVEQNCV